MAVSSSASISMAALLFLTTLLSNAVVSHQQPVLNPTEQESVYRVLESINPTYSWRSAYPDDLCSSAPYGVVCDYFLDDGDNATTQTETLYPHITELRFGYVSDYTPNPVCTHNSTFDPSLFTSFTYLRKLFFYQCFTQTRVSVPEIPSGFGSNLEELVFIDNPSLVSPLSGILGNYTNLRRVVLTGNGFYGNVPNILGELINLEEITVTSNQLNGTVLTSFAFDNLKKLKVLDLSHSDFEGDVPDSIRRLTELLKLDLSYNRFTGIIPEGIKDLKRLELLDLSFNHFGNFGIPLFLGEIPSLREVHLSGNLLGGVIPEIWKNLGGILGLGLSNMGLVGNIPNSLGVHLRSLCYLGLDNNKLEGTVPMEFQLLKNVSEVNLENNLLSGKISFTAQFTGKIGKKLKLGGNPELCVDDGVKSRNRESLGQLKICNKTNTPNPALLLHGGGSSSTVSSSQLLMSLGFFGLFILLN